MLTSLVVIAAVLAIAIALALVGVVMSVRGNGSVPIVGGWIAIVSGLVAVCFAVALVVMLIGASMDDVPGLW